MQYRNFKIQVITTDVRNQQKIVYNWGAAHLPSVYPTYPIYLFHHKDQSKSTLALFILMQEKNIDIWKRKLEWVAENGDMALVNTHLDYMDKD